MHIVKAIIIVIMIHQASAKVSVCQSKLASEVQASDEANDPSVFEPAWIRIDCSVKKWTQDELTESFTGSTTKHFRSNLGHCRPVHMNQCICTDSESVLYNTLTSV